MLARLALLLGLLGGSAALRTPLASRRAVVAQAGSLAVLTTGLPAGAKPTELASGKISKEERTELALKRKAAEETAQLPLNRLKAKREGLAKADELIASGSWDALRDLIQLETGPSLSKLQSENKWQTKEVRIARVCWLLRRGRRAARCGRLQAETADRQGAAD